MEWSGKDEFFNCVQATDTLYTVLERMHVNRTHKVFVLSPTGQPVGVVSLMDLSRLLISIEGAEKVNLNDFCAARKHTDRCVRETAQHGK